MPVPLDTSTYNTDVDHDEAMHTEDVAIFETPPVNIGERKKIWIDQLPTSQGTGVKRSVIFHIPGTGEQYTDLSETELYVKLKILDENGNTFEQSPTKSAIPIDMILHSMWSMVNIKLNQTLVDTSGTNYMYKSYIETLLNYSEKTKKIKMSAIGFTGDSGNFDQTGVEEVPFNQGLKERYLWFKRIYTVKSPSDPFNPATDDSDEEYDDPSCVEFLGPLMTDLCNQGKLIVNGVDIDIRLVPNNDEFRLLTFPNGQKGYIQIEDIKLSVCKVDVTDKFFVGHHKGMEYSAALYPFARSDVRTFNIVDGSYQAIFEDIFQGETPSRLIVGMVDSEAYAGDYSKNPFRFKHFNIQEAAFYVDGESTPRQPYNFDFKDCGYLEGLMSLYRVSGKMFTDTDIGITRETYRQGLALIGFEVDPTAAPDLSYVGIPKSGRTRLVLKFKKKIKKPVTVIVYGIFPEVMEISLARIISMKEKDRALKRLRK